jgi:hypothetical protein
MRTFWIGPLWLQVMSGEENTGHETRETGLVMASLPLTSKLLSESSDLLRLATVSETFILTEVPITEGTVVAQLPVIPFVDATNVLE